MRSFRSSRTATTLRPSCGPLSPSLSKPRLVAGRRRPRRQQPCGRHSSSRKSGGCRRTRSAPTDENMRFTPSVVANERLEAKVYGPGASVVRAAEHEGANRSLDGAATSPVAVTLRDKRNYIGPDGPGATALDRAGRTASTCCYPVVKLADGTYAAGNRGITTDGEFLQVEVAFGGMRWYQLDPVKVVVTSEVKNPELEQGRRSRIGDARAGRRTRHRGIGELLDGGVVREGRAEIIPRRRTVSRSLCTPSDGCVQWPAVQ